MHRDHRLDTILYEKAADSIRQPFVFLFYHARHCTRQLMMVIDPDARRLFLSTTWLQTSCAVK